MRTRLRVLSGKERARLHQRTRRFVGKKEVTICARLSASALVGSGVLVTGWAAIFNQLGLGRGPDTPLSFFLTLHLCAASKAAEASPLPQHCIPPSTHSQAPNHLSSTSTPTRSSACSFGLCSLLSCSLLQGRPAAAAQPSHAGPTAQLQQGISSRRPAAAAAAAAAPPPPHQQQQSRPRHGSAMPPQPPRCCGGAGAPGPRRPAAAAPARPSLAAL
jgi:hypothetical protein